jgi:uncharacterized protein YeaO (DUF488 family)
MPVKTKNVFAIPEDLDGERYLITRLYAGRLKSMKELCITKWRIDIAPSKELLYDYIHIGISQEEYTKRFNQEISSRPKAQEILAELRSKHNQGQTITLLCKCEEGEFCHRHLIKQMIIAGNL